VSSEHDIRHEAWLETLIADGGESLPREARAAVESCDTCREERARLESFAAALDAHGRADRELLAESRAHAPDLEAFRRRALAATAVTAPPTTARIRSRSWLAWLAAACVAVALAYALTQRGKPDDDGTLGPRGNSIVLRRPLSPVASYAPFEWSGPLDPNGWFVVFVWNGAQDPDRDPPWITQKVTERTWSPDRTDWPDSIYWRVRSYDSSTTSGLQSSLGSASLRR
jgi:hypothetical protein